MSSKSSDRSSKCPLCYEEFGNKDTFVLHIRNHLGYKEFNCRDCSSCFYTEEQRMSHCSDTGHGHSFDTNRNKYNEMLIYQIRTDADRLALYDVDFVVKQRTSAFMEYEQKFEKAAESEYKKVIRRPDSSTAAIPRKRTSSKGPSTSYKPPTPPRPSKGPTQPSSVKRTRACSTSSATSRVSVKNVARRASHDREKSVPRSPVLLPTPQVSSAPLKVSAPENLADALKTISPTTKCTVCKKEISSAYVDRKHHVSIVHMRSDHTEEDYVDMLEENMKRAFPGTIYSDFQCQISGCGKMFTSESGRRGHVISAHSSSELYCNVPKCTYSSKLPKDLEKHFKDTHGYGEGTKCMSDEQLEEYKNEKRKHNTNIKVLVQKAFPCPIPHREKPAKSQPLQRSSEVDKTISLTAFQAPPRALRQRTPSSGEESCAESTNEDIPLSGKKKKKSANKKSRTIEQQQQVVDEPLERQQTDIKYEDIDSTLDSEVMEPMSCESSKSSLNSTMNDPKIEISESSDDDEIHFLGERKKGRNKNSTLTSNQLNVSSTSIENGGTKAEAQADIVVPDVKDVIMAPTEEPTVDMSKDERSSRDKSSRRSRSPYDRNRTRSPYDRDRSRRRSPSYDEYRRRDSSRDYRSYSSSNYRRVDSYSNRQSRDRDDRPSSRHGRPSSYSKHSSYGYSQNRYSSRDH